jgi:hypothetical protein
MSDALERTKQAMRDEYEARRCCICQCRHPGFGFGPPMTRETIWACGKHQAEVEAKLRASNGNGSHLGE